MSPLQAETHQKAAREAAEAAEAAEERLQAAQRRETSLKGKLTQERDELSRKNKARVKEMCKEVRAERDKAVQDKDALVLENQAIRECNQRLEGQFTAGEVPRPRTTALYTDHDLTASTATYTYKLSWVSSTLGFLGTRGSSSKALHPCAVNTVNPVESLPYPHPQLSGCNGVGVQLGGSLDDVKGQLVKMAECAICNETGLESAINTVQ
eukprot:9497847-Pyramimonas_sp.AAC.1